MSNTNPSSKDDLDFGLLPAGDSKSGKGGARSRKVMALIALVIAEGVVIGVMASFWPPAVPVTRTISTNPTLSNYVNPINPELTQKGDVYVGVTSFYYYEGYISWPLHQRPAGLTDAVITFTISSWNYTWWNVSLVSALWDGDTMNWNNRPPTGACIANMSVAQRAYPDVYAVRLDVTDLVLTGTNLSLCFAPLLNCSGYGAILGRSLVWTYTVSTAGVPFPATIFMVVMSLVPPLISGEKRRISHRSGGSA